MASSTVILSANRRSNIALGAHELRQQLATRKIQARTLLVLLIG